MFPESIKYAGRPVRVRFASSPLVTSGTFSFADGSPVVIFGLFVSSADEGAGIGAFEFETDTFTVQRNVSAGFVLPFNPNGYWRMPSGVFSWISGTLSFDVHFGIIR